MEVCDGSVLLGKMVWAVREYAPSRISRARVRAPNFPMAAGRKPSIETITTCPDMRPAGSSEANAAAGAATARANRAAIRRLSLDIELTSQGFCMLAAIFRRGTRLQGGEVSCTCAS